MDKYHKKSGGMLERHMTPRVSSNVAVFANSGNPWVTSREQLAIRREADNLDIFSEIPHENPDIDRWTKAGRAKQTSSYIASSRPVGASRLDIGAKFRRIQLQLALKHRRTA